MRNRGFVPLLVALASVPSIAAAQTPPDRDDRTFGIGTAIGFGGSYNLVPDLTPPRIAPNWQIDVANLELRFFLPHEHSIDLYSQLGNTLASAALAALPRCDNQPGTLVFANIAALYNLNLPLGGPDTRLLLASGVEVGGDWGRGGSYEQTHPLKATFRLPARVGIERLNRDHTIGVQFMARAFFEAAAYGSNAGVEVVTHGLGGVLGEVGLVFYPRARAARSAPRQ